MKILRYNVLQFLKMFELRRFDFWTGWMEWDHSEAGFPQRWDGVGLPGIGVEQLVLHAAINVVSRTD